MKKSELKKKVLPYWKRLRKAEFWYYGEVQMIEKEMQKKIGDKYEFASNGEGVIFGIGKQRKNGTYRCVLNDMDLGCVKP